MIEGYVFAHQVGLKHCHLIPEALQQIQRSLSVLLFQCFIRHQHPANSLSNLNHSNLILGNLHADGYRGHLSAQRPAYPKVDRYEVILVDRGP